MILWPEERSDLVQSKRWLLDFHCHRDGRVDTVRPLKRSGVGGKQRSPDGPFHSFAAETVAVSARCSQRLFLRAQRRFIGSGNA